ncbi:molecular chaperone Hsp33 [Eubacterium uniforme]|uniref:33 kDa chaperonin n=1 Tax=Eubacterium uniforme TaxID=39495 RepID=A0A1T4VCA8_9FIRM|nr:Hsp33 family molecular chaperone HslO [Eubacterium uniforme]SKA62556.1 molecular chaperone Hsp33 [Eubacterium uniforme]
MSDYILRATAADDQIRAFVANTKELVEEARERHGLSKVCTAALGRLLTGGAMMGIMMKGDEDVLTLQMKGDGPINGVTVTADSKGNVKGYVGNPEIELPPNYAGKLDVGAAIGYGTLTVIKDLGLKEPYASSVPLGTSEVAEDLTYYFATSEQVPSAVALGVLVDKDGSVKQAGGFILQVMPNATEETISFLEEKINNTPSVTSMLEEGKSAEDILEFLLGDLGINITEKVPTKYYCNCSRERVSKVWATLPKKDIEDIIGEGKDVEIKCHFCNSGYSFSVDEIKDICKDILK